MTEICPVCGVEFPIKPCHKNRFKGPFCCSMDCRAELLRTIYKGSSNPNSKYNDNAEKFFAIRCADIQRRAKEKNIDFNLTPDFLYRLYEEQNGLCYYSGIPMKLGSTSFKAKGQADLDTVSVDKITPEKGYIRENVVLCCSGVNKLKGNADPVELQVFLSGLAMKTFGTCRIRFKKVRSEAKAPFRAKLGDGGYDLFAADVEDLGDQVKVYSGIAVEPDPGWTLFALPRSSISNKGLRLANSIGLIDNQYRGEIIGVFDKVKNGAGIFKGERVLQIVPMRCPFVLIEETDDLSTTDRGLGGFGSTGR